MKVTDASQIKALQPSKAPEPGRTPAAEHSEKADRVTTEAAAKVAEAVATASLHVSADRASKLAAIEAQVRQGTYRPDPQAIAQQILDDAELAARLQALFMK